ncbi:MAG: alpha/beta hydrolase fold domain-containing protein [Cyclobacteriaceae bacterium]|nr:alpha/beta hydrolase fold domain-containing protein [Cyclobacteriaceae bacterium]
MKSLIISLLMILSFSSYSQQVIPLYADPAPGSESWTWDEKETSNNLWGTRIVYNVSKPTLTAFLPNRYAATGTAIIICPGGAFHTLSIDNEGNDVARWLNQKGVAAFVLKYRVVRSLTDDPVKELMAKMGDFKKLDEENAPVVPLAVADGKKAIEYVRQHAAELGINPDRIGIMGFSAGGTLATSVAYSYAAANKPNFVAPVYPYMGAVAKMPVPADAPPMFIVAATDDQLGLASHSVQLYSDWISAKKIAELHMYQHGGHGFGMHQQDIPTDTWIDRFGDWLDMQGLLKPTDPNHWSAKYTPQQLLRFRKEGEERTRNDWANMKKFQDDNKKLTSPKPGENRVVFMGNSITEGWSNADPSFFEGKPYINRGISGQTTPQMVLRFRQDVIDLKPKVVVILAGTNDIAGNTGPMTLEQTRDNIISMAELAQAHGIKVVLSSVIPAFDYPWKPGLAPAEKIVSLNKMLKAYANKNSIVYLDYFSAMADERNGLKKELGYDGVHPNLAGYKVMAPLAEQAIAKALAQAK